VQVIFIDRESFVVVVVVVNGATTVEKVSFFPSYISVDIHTTCQYYLFFHYSLLKSINSCHSISFHLLFHLHFTKKRKHFLVQFLTVANHGYDAVSGQTDLLQEGTQSHVFAASIR
jgi:hypothetical protein